MVRRGSRGSAPRMRIGIWAGLFCVGLPIPQLTSPAGDLVGIVSQQAAFAQAKSQVIEIAMPQLVRVPAAAESDFHIELSPRTAVPDRAILLIKGLPSAVSLSHGRLFESGVWAVPATNLGDLRMISGSTLLSKVDFTVSLVTLSGNVLAESGSSLSIVRAGQPLETTAAIHQADQVSSGDQTAQQVVPNILPAPPSGKTLESVVLYMQKGDDFLKNGNINMARAFYTQAADLGWAEGALALGTTYDPTELGKLRVIGGIQPDAAMAKRWYEKAAELGSAQAQTRLSTLGAER
jgi:hypothetical protein